jgi:hypothetical protein
MSYTPKPACMGGFCSERNACPNHNAEDRRNPVERLCHPGEEREHVWKNIALMTGQKGEATA